MSKALSAAFHRLVHRWRAFPVGSRLVIARYRHFRLPARSLCGMRACLSRPGAWSDDVSDWESCCRGRDGELPGRGPGWCRHVGETLEELVQGGWPSSTAARSSSVRGTETSIRCRLALASRSWALEESFGA